MRKELANINDIKIIEDGDYIISSFSNLEIEKNVKCSLLIKEVNSFHILVNEGAALKVETILENQIKNLDFATKIEKNGTFAMFLADFANDSFSLNSITNLDGENASSSFQISSIAKDKEVKKYNISFNHNCPKTYSDLVSYGVSQNQASLSFLGVSHIKEKCQKSEAYQKAKIIVFDKEAKGSSSPSLRIDNNDIIASHGATVGRLNDEHLFYLCSRGISENDAKKLISLGYISPIIDKFDDEEMKNHIQEMIERSHL